MDSHMAPTDPMQVTMATPTVTAMVTMAARRGRPSLLLRPRLTPGTATATTADLMPTALIVDTTATATAILTDMVLTGENKLFILSKNFNIWGV